MVAKVFNHGRVVFQTPAEDEIPEQAILAHLDASGLLVLTQESAHIVIQPGSVDDLIKTLRQLRTISQQG